MDHVGSEWLELPDDGTGIGATHVAAERLADDVVHDLKIRFYDPVETFGDEFAAAPRSAATSRPRCWPTSGSARSRRETSAAARSGGKLVHLGRDTPFGLVLRSNFWLGYGLPLSPERAGAGDAPARWASSLMQHSSQEWFYLMRFLPALYIAERRDEVPAPVAW